MTALASTTATQVAIVGGGPAGLMLSHLLHNAGIDSVVIDNRTVEQIETTHRAGIPRTRQRPTPRRFRCQRPGAHRRSRTRGHRAAVRRPQSPHRLPETRRGVVLALPADRGLCRSARGPRPRRRDPRYGTTDTEVSDVVDAPTVDYTDADGSRHRITARIVVGADGSRSVCRPLIDQATQYFREYPFAWFGVMVQAPPSAS